MTLAAINATPLFLHPGNVGPLGTIILDANDEKAAFIVQAPKTGSIDRVLFRTAAVSIGDTVDVRVETIGTDGFPSGTLWAANTNASQIILASDDNVWFEVTLTASASVTRGEIFAIVVSLPSIAVGNLQIARISGTQNFVKGFPLPHVYAAGAWGGGSGDGGAVCGVRYSDGSYPNLNGVLTGTTASTGFNNSSSPDERGNKITVPIDCKVVGCWVLRSAAANGDVTYKLYDNAGSLAASKAFDGDILDRTSGGLYLLLFDTEVTINAGDVVRITALPTTATNTDINTLTGVSSSHAAALPGAGNVVLTTRTDAGAWTDTVGSESTIGLLLSAGDDGAGGGGGTHSYGYLS